MRGQFSEASDGSDPSVSVCFVVQNRTAVHDQQAQPRTERPRRRGGGRPERALRGPSPWEWAVHARTFGGDVVVKCFSNVIQDLFESYKMKPT